MIKYSEVRDTTSATIPLCLVEYYRDGKVKKRGQADTCSVWRRLYVGRNLFSMVNGLRKRKYVEDSIFISGTRRSICRDGKGSL